MNLTILKTFGSRGIGAVMAQLAAKEGAQKFF